MDSVSLASINNKTSYRISETTERFYSEVAKKVRCDGYDSNPRAGRLDFNEPGTWFLLGIVFLLALVFLLPTILPIMGKVLGKIFSLFKSNGKDDDDLGSGKTGGGSHSSSTRSSSSPPQKSNTAMYVGVAVRNPALALGLRQPLGRISFLGRGVSHWNGAACVAKTLRVSR
jgi:hypothetical protein